VRVSTDISAMPIRDGRRQVVPTLIVLAALAVLGTALMLLMTRKGIGLWEDSFDYITAARTLAQERRLGRYDGFGDFRPMTHFPPGYPAALALFDALGVDVYVGARWLSCAAFGVTLSLAALTLLLVTRSFAWALFGAGLLLTSEALIGVHLWALSEPIYLLLGLAALLLLARYMEHPRSPAFLLLAALAAALVLLTRYAGISVILAAVGGLWYLLDQPVPRRLRDILIFLPVSVIPSAAFAVRNQLTSGNPVDRLLAAWHPPTRLQWEQAARTVLNWGLPDIVVERLSGAAGLLGLAFVCVLAILAAAWLVWSRRQRQHSPKAPWTGLLLLLIFYGVMYLLVVLGTIVFLDRMTLLDNRLLSPFYLAGVIIATSLLAEAWGRTRGRGRIPIAVVCVLVVGFSLFRFYGLIRVLPEDAKGFASNAWRQSETIAAVRDLPPLPLYSNEIQALYFLTGRTAIFVPTPINPATGQPRDDYATSLAEMRRMVAHGEAMLVLFASPEEILQDGGMSDLTLGLPLIAQQADGAVFGRIQDEGVGLLPGCQGQVLVQDGV